MCLTVAQSAGTRGVMHITNPTLIVRLFAATLVTVATIGLSTVATHPTAKSVLVPGPGTGAIVHRTGDQLSLPSGTAIVFPDHSVQ